jgi:hypothetical protein
VLELALELPVAREAREIELSCLQGLPDSATRLGLVGAVAETATGRELGDVLECLLHAVLRLGELQLAHARCVEEEPAARDRDQLPPRRRVAAATVAAEVSDLDVAAGQAVDESRLADAR